jgi:hypothetical protein
MYRIFVSHDSLLTHPSFTFALPYFCELFEEKNTKLTWEEVEVLVHILRSVLQKSDISLHESLLRCFVYGTPTHTNALTGLWLFLQHHATELQTLFQQSPSQLHQSFDSLLDLVCLLFNHPHPKFRPLIHERFRMAFTSRDSSVAVVHSLTLLCELFHRPLPPSDVPPSTQQVYWVLKVRLLYTLLALFTALEVCLILKPLHIFLSLNF